MVKHATACILVGLFFLLILTPPYPPPSVLSCPVLMEMLPLSARFLIIGHKSFPWDSVSLAKLPAQDLLFITPGTGYPRLVWYNDEGEVGTGKLAREKFNLKKYIFIFTGGWLLHPVIKPKWPPGAGVCSQEYRARQPSGVLCASSFNWLAASPRS